MPDPTSLVTPLVLCFNDSFMCVRQILKYYLNKEFHAGVKIQVLLAFPQLFSFLNESVWATVIFNWIQECQSELSWHDPDKHLGCLNRKHSILSHEQRDIFVLFLYCWFLNMLVLFPQTCLLCLQLYEPLTQKCLLTSFLFIP